MVGEFLMVINYKRVVCKVLREDVWEPVVGEFIA